MPDAPDATIGAPLEERDRVRGRRLAITSHPAGMTFRMVFTEHLPTLALVALGASELQVGIQGALLFTLIALRLPTLRAVSRVAKRRILLVGHNFSLLAAVPLLFFDRLEALGSGAGVAIALLSFGLVAVGLNVAETVWFPLLRAYVEPDRIGRFFGTLRTGWHLALIGFFSFAQWWLARHPGDFGPLFALGWGAGWLRTALIARLPERSERTGERIRVRESFALARDPRLRGYLTAVAWGQSVRVAAIPFSIVWMRRVLGFDASDVLYTTVALFTGGLVSLYPWGRIVDRVGAVPVLRFTAVGSGLLIACLALLPAQSIGAVPQMVVWTFAISVLVSGFGVADTQLLFEHTPAHSPARTLVLAAVVVGAAGGASPLLAGAALELALPANALPANGFDAGGVYRLFFAVLGVFGMGAFLPLRVFRLPTRRRDAN